MGRLHDSGHSHSRVEHVPVCVYCIQRRRDFILGLIAVGLCVVSSLGLYLTPDKPVRADTAAQALQQLPMPQDEGSQPSPPTEVMKLRNNGYSDLLAKRYDHALSLFRQASDLGDAYAPMYIGYIYENGLGVRRNPGSALGWYRTAETRGNPQASDAIQRLSRGPK